MILHSILENDIHRSKVGSKAVPLWLEEPVPANCVPALVSGSRGNFLVSRKLTNDGRIRVGIFDQDPDRSDDLVGPAFEAALSLSRAENWPNIFKGPSAISSAFDYVKKSCPAPGQPHVCVYPREWEPKVVKKAFGMPWSPVAKYKGYCRLVPGPVNIPVMLSRPDMVGKVSQIVGGKMSIVLHNVKLGMAFALV
jgi:hypothetical protein